MKNYICKTTLELDSVHTKEEYSLVTAEGIVQATDYIQNYFEGWVILKLELELINDTNYFDIDKNIYEWLDNNVAPDMYR